VVTEMATAPRRGSGSGEGASLTASVAALLRVPGSAEVRGFGIKTDSSKPLTGMFYVTPACPRQGAQPPGARTSHDEDNLNLYIFPDTGGRMQLEACI